MSSKTFEYAVKHDIGLNDLHNCLRQTQYIVKLVPATKTSSDLDIQDRDNSFVCLVYERETIDATEDLYLHPDILEALNSLNQQYIFVIEYVAPQVLYTSKFGVDYHSPNLEHLISIMSHLMDCFGGYICCEGDWLEPYNKENIRDLKCR